MGVLEASCHASSITYLCCSKGFLFFDAFYVLVGCLVSPAQDSSMTCCPWESSWIKVGQHPKGGGSCPRTPKKATPVQCLTFVLPKAELRNIIYRKYMHIPIGLHVWCCFRKNWFLVQMAFFLLMWPNHTKSLFTTNTKAASFIRTFVGPKQWEYWLTLELC